MNSKTIFGGKAKNPAAFCKLHNGYLTVKEMRKKECLKKQCYHLIKNKEHNYWEQRDALKFKKKGIDDVLPNNI